MKKSRADKLYISLTINVEEFYKSFEFTKGVCSVNLPKNITFLDEYRNKHEIKMSLASHGQNCHWDRHPFDWDGIQCPLRKEYIPTLHVYQSDINENTYAIQDSINTTKCHYISEGYFCSPECCLAYIEENLHDPKYQDSKELLFEIIGRLIRKAGPWRLLKEYGGHQPIEEFRGSFTNKIFTLEAVVFSPSYFIYKESYHF